jgi:hypothetical protein
MRHAVPFRAAQLAAEYGPDVEEALCRWTDAGGMDGGADAKAWLSVAFLFSRQRRAAAPNTINPIGA